MAVQLSVDGVHKDDGNKAAWSGWADAHGTPASRADQAVKWDLREHRAMIGAIAAVIFYAGWVSSAFYFNIAARWQNEHKLIAVETKVVPQLQTSLKQANCDKTALRRVAAQGIAAGQSDDIDAPGWADLHGCPKVAPVKPPSVAVIVKK